MAEWNDSQIRWQTIGHALDDRDYAGKFSAIARLIGKDMIDVWEVGM